MKYLSLLVVFALGSFTGLAQKKQKPNVLFIISDDLTATALSCYENEYCQTPNIDRLASEGVRFTRTYTQFPVCGPSRASFMFGYYPNATGTYGYVSGREAVGPTRDSWSQLFKKNGYYTARVSKIFLSARLKSSPYFTVLFAKRRMRLPSGSVNNFVSSA